MNMKRLLTILLFPITILLSGCDPVNSDMARTMQVMYGQLRIEPSLSPSDGFDYLVSFPVMVDFGFNTRNPDDRVRYVKGVMKPQCDRIKILDEKQTITGKFPNGKDRIQYSITVDCI